MLCVSSSKSTPVSPGRNDGHTAGKPPAGVSSFVTAPNVIDCSSNDIVAIDFWSEPAPPYQLKTTCEPSGAKLGIDAWKSFWSKPDGKLAVAARPLGSA